MFIRPMNICSTLDKQSKNKMTGSMNIFLKLVQSIFFFTNKLVMISSKSINDTINEN